MEYDKELASRLLTETMRELPGYLISVKAKEDDESFLTICALVAISAGDATLPLVLSMQKFSTLSLFTYRLAASYRFTEACVSGLILGLVCSIVFFAAKRFGGEK